MKKILKINLIALRIGVCVLILSITAYDLFVFKSYRLHIESIIQGSHSFYKKPSKALLEIATITEGKRFKSYVAQMSLIRFGRNIHDMLKWHIEYALWVLLLGIHFDNDEIFTLWCYFAPYEKGTGLNESANFYYGRAIEQLNEKEIALIIAMIKAPSYYKDHPKKLEERVDELLSKYSDCP